MTFGARFAWHNSRLPIFPTTLSSASSAVFLDTSETNRRGRRRVGSLPRLHPLRRRSSCTKLRHSGWPHLPQIPISSNQAFSRP